MHAHRGGHIGEERRRVTEEVAPYAARWCAIGANESAGSQVQLPRVAQRRLSWDSLYDVRQMPGIHGCLDP